VYCPEGYAFIYISFAIAAVIVVISPARIAQEVYDKADLLASSRYGWLLLGIAFGSCSFEFIRDFS
jgi:hypothetical protein